MVFVWGWGNGPRRRRGYGPPPGYGRGYGPGYGRGYGPPPGYYGRGGGGGDSCLRNLLFFNAGCCLAESLGCGVDLLLIAPHTMRSVRSAGPRRRVADRLVAAIRVYQREISPRRDSCCHFTPSCSAYGAEAIERHGALRGSWLTARRLLRCRPGGRRGADPVPA
ncbi:membrane protein insertion efficiency factor YidD [Modestobacter sp. NPDC049651]|uniref:membrane protein insertion efficiency factor YidD n=1 Tax=unclassified Modestobacter TaxID=2643866 RepID=UPI00340575FC